jgi:GATA-binding protein, other eukaryote
MSGSPDLKTSRPAHLDPEKLAKEDPLATQMWKMYARTKAHLPHAQRMENITWRMMALELRKKEEARSADLTQDFHPDTTPNPPSEPSRPSDERGRPIDKGTTRVYVVGFDDRNQDGVGEEE